MTSPAFQHCLTLPCWLPTPFPLEGIPTSIKGCLNTLWRLGSLSNRVWIVVVVDFSSRLHDALLFNMPKKLRLYMIVTVQQLTLCTFANYDQISHRHTLPIKNPGGSMHCFVLLSHCTCIYRSQWVEINIITSHL